MAPVNPWTEWKVEQLKLLFATGLSFREIAAELGSGFTRNSVLAKSYRLGLAKRGAARSKKRIAYAGAEKPKRKHCGYDSSAIERRLREQRSVTDDGSLTPVDLAALDNADDQAIPLHQRKTLMELGRCHCRFPVGDPGTPEFFFCGAPASAGSSYCVTHHVRVYQPARSSLSTFVPRGRAA